MVKLPGSGGVANLLLNGAVSHDEYGTNILSYMDKSGDYDSPFGTAGEDFLSGSDYGETFIGKEGDNTYETGAGGDKIIIEQRAGGQDTITDFDQKNDVISLSIFQALSFLICRLVRRASMPMPFSQWAVTYIAKCQCIISFR